MSDSLMDSNSVVSWQQSRPGPLSAISFMLSFLILGPLFVNLTTPNDLPCTRNSTAFHPTSFLSTENRTFWYLLFSFVKHANSFIQGDFPWIPTLYIGHRLAFPAIPLYVSQAFQVHRSLITSLDCVSTTNSPTMKPTRVEIRDIVLTILCLSHTIAAATHPQDIQALKSIKVAIDGASIKPTSCLGTWDFSVDPCENAFTTKFVCGLECEYGNGTIKRVQGLVLDDAGYTGMLSPYIGNLSALQRLDIGRNAFEGPIPNTLQQLTNLQTLDLSGNQLSGAIPESIGQLTNATQLCFANNLLEGEIPRSIANLKTLAALELNNNRLTGFLPPGLNTLEKLKRFDASHNHLCGKLPSLLPPLLVALSLRNNQLVGRLPRTLSELQQLSSIDLSSNQLYGGINAIFDNPTIQQINLSSNNFTWIYSNQRSVLNSQLVAADLSFNLLGGRLPIWMASMKRLSALYLQNNRFSGMIPKEYALKAVGDLPGIQPFQRLFLNQNYLMGKIPTLFLSTRAANLVANFDNNCLEVCPTNLSFCQGPGQKSKAECKVVIQD